ncbi:guanine-1-methyltransferase-domain-containing protein [Plectosphaerella plurivora]|uniref:tRNA (guanine(9)-N1)-methyltransferase n=1 Tax=Plectosphaerella plurivora TaxID=936078 RepID=A0A9P8VCK4_9PEZI|nr:guanine-1-methyltransferase-domain-containing protein [Plectosphaerella plurivora]
MDSTTSEQPVTTSQEALASVSNVHDTADTSSANNGLPTATGGDAPDTTTVSEPKTESDVKTEAGAEETKMSKGQMRRLKRQAIWEERRDDRKRKRKDKRHERQARKRDEKAALIAEAEAAGIDPATVLHKPPPKPPVRVPVGIILDCDFEKYMMEGERISLASQITRCYSDNRKSKVQAHLYVSSFGGEMKERYETILGNQHVQWKAIKFSERDFIETSRVPVDDVKNIVYLSSDSPYTLERLEPNTCYIIGGLVDKNREKGLCHRRAREKGIRTAKLPIGDYLEMASRRVLATNHVVEIMIRWLESGDWAKAFLEVIPKRKGGKLRGSGEAGEPSVADEDESRIEDEEENGDADVDVDEVMTSADAVSKGDAKTAAPATTSSS